MSSAIESTIRALVEFESELDGAKAEAAESKKKLIKDATDWAAAAKSKATAEAQRIASENVAIAREEAEAEAESIRKKGRASLKTFEDSISKNRSKAVEHATSRLLGESP
jgi:vacuolar-type H+-ATPase subunit H